MKLSDKRLAALRELVKGALNMGETEATFTYVTVAKLLDTIDVLKAELERSEFERDWLKRERNDE